MAFQVTKVELYPDELLRMAGVPKVRAALHQQAEKIAAGARGLAGSGEVADTIFVQDGTRPKGRPYSRAVSDPTRFGRSMPGKTDRRALLCQAADIR